MWNKTDVAIIVIYVIHVNVPLASVSRANLSPLPLRSPPRPVNMPRRVRGVRENV